MPSSRSDRNTRMAISPRFATRTFEKGGASATRRILSGMSFANQLTVGRTVAVPVVILLFAWDFPNHYYWGTAVFCVAMATDWLDGWWARRVGDTSNLGGLLDPIADKVLVLAALVMLIGDAFPAWMVSL